MTGASASADRAGGADAPEPVPVSAKGAHPSRVPYKLLDLFSGIGGFSLGLERTGGFKTVAFCEQDKFNQRVLRSHWPEVPMFDDVRTLRGDQVGHVDGICGGFPCQDASVANVFGLGASGSRTGLFREIVRLASEMGPAFVVLENVTGLFVRGFGYVLGALAEIGFDAEWECFLARECGAPHKRERIVILAYPQCEGREGFKPYRGVLGRAKAALSEHGHSSLGGWSELVERQRGVRIGDGVSIGLERQRLHALGNAIVPTIPEFIGRSILASERIAA